MFRFLKHVVEGIKDDSVLGNVLVELGYLTEIELKRGIAYQQKKENKLLGDSLIELGVLTPEMLNRALGFQKELLKLKNLLHNEEEFIDHIKSNDIVKKALGDYISFFFDIDFVHMDEIDLDPNLISKFDMDFLKNFGVIPYLETGDSIYFISGDIGNDNTILKLRNALSDIDKEIKLSYTFDFDIKEQFIFIEGNLSVIDKEDSNYIIKWVNKQISLAIQNRASDLHLEPIEDGLKIRYRIDGVISYNRDIMLSQQFVLAVFSRIKIMSKGMDIAEKHKPQDGSISDFELENKMYDLRISSMYTAKGEKIVIRIHPHDIEFTQFSALGFTKEDITTLKSIVNLSNGILYVGGATGSGKSVTLQTILQYLNDSTKNINTVEDPVERVIDGINQTQINPSAGITFPLQLRALLRQDPDIIVVGETRDLETAEISVRSSLTGHLVMTTIHVNNALGIISRLIDMGVESHLLGASAKGFACQRLLRKICPHCSEKIELEPTQEIWLDSMGFNIDDVDFYKGKGCSVCNHTGYYGRTGIIEIIRIDEELSRMISKSYPLESIKDYLEEIGYETLFDKGFKKLTEGITTIEELQRIL